MATMDLSAVSSRVPSVISRLTIIDLGIRVKKMEVERCQ